MSVQGIAGHTPIAAPLDPAALEQQVVDLLRSYVGDEVSPEEPLNKQGLDSLAAMELRQKLQVRITHTWETGNDVRAEKEGREQETPRQGDNTHRLFTPHQVRPELAVRTARTLQHQ